MDLYAQLDRIFAARDRANMQPTIDALLPLYESHPADARVLLELGGAYDTAGNEKQARGLYERALEAGLEGEHLRRCYVQYGSTLRNVGAIEESLAVFARARHAFPDSAALAAFEAISLHAGGRLHESVAALLRAVADYAPGSDVARYSPALRGNADYIAGLGARPADWPGRA